MRKHYTVAGHGFTVDAEEAIFNRMEQYTPFLDEENMDSLFTLHVQESATPIIYKEKYRQDELGQLTICGETPDGKTVLEYQMNDKVAGWVVCSHDFAEAFSGLKTDVRDFNTLIEIYNQLKDYFQTNIIIREG